jgi:hypothetical protein
VQQFAPDATVMFTPRSATASDSGCERAPRLTPPPPLPCRSARARRCSSSAARTPRRRRRPRASRRRRHHHHSAARITQGDTVIQTLSLTVIDLRCLGNHTVILRSLLSLPVKLTVSPWTRQEGWQEGAGEEGEDGVGAEADAAPPRGGRCRGAAGAAVGGGRGHAAAAGQVSGGGWSRIVYYSCTMHGNISNVLLEYTILRRTAAPPSQAYNLLPSSRRTG